MLFDYTCELVLSFVFLGSGKNVMTSYGYGYKQNTVIG